MLGFLLAAAMAAKPATAHLCWIARVEREGTGVRIVFADGAPIADPAKGVHVEPGERVSPASSGHDGCTLTVTRRAGALGVAAEAHLFLPGVMDKPDVRREWIEAEPGR
jgi:hypothetical protein